VQTLIATRQNIVTEKHVHDSVARLAQDNLGVYHVPFMEMSAKSRLVLAAAAQQGATTFAGLAEALRSKGAPMLAAEVTQHAVQLGRRGLLRVEDEQVTVAANLLALWLIQHHPLEVLLTESVENLGPFRLLEKLGEGGMGVVYRAQDLLSERVVALKVMREGLLANDDARKRFLREAEMGLRFKHPHIVRILARGESEGRCYIAMEFIDGIPLRRYIRDQRRLPWPLALEILRAVLSALAEIHQKNVVHRDIKSDNIMLAGPERVPKLTDFGLAHWADLSSITRSNALVGTMAYMAPEQIEGEEASPSWDLYAVAVVAYEMLTGTLPFKHDMAIALLRAITREPPEPPSARGVDLPATFEAVLLRMLAKHPEDRYPTASECDRALAAIALPSE
jgi:serine/threonine protein kinase